MDKKMTLVFKNFDNKNQSSVYYNENYTQELFNYFQNINKLNLKINQ